MPFSADTPAGGCSLGRVIMPVTCARPDFKCASERQGITTRLPDLLPCFLVLDSCADPQALSESFLPAGRRAGHHARTAVDPDELERIIAMKRMPSKKPGIVRMR